MNQLSNLVQTMPDAAPKTARGRKTWLKILEAAAKEFGSKGFHEAAIYRITENAGVAMGTFYVHFESKEEIYRVLVSHMGHVTRHWISERIADAPDRLTAERLGIEAFIDFVREQSDLYRIINEAQFVAPDAYKRYYSDFAEAYERNLSDAVSRGEIRDGDNGKRVWALIGASVFLGMRFGIWDKSIPTSEIAASIGDLLESGLAPEGPSKGRK